MAKALALLFVILIIAVILIVFLPSSEPPPEPPEGSILVHRISSEVYELELRVNEWPKKIIKHVTPLSFWYRIKAKEGINSINFYLTSPTIEGTSTPATSKMIRQGKSNPGKLEFKFGEMLPGEKYKIFINGEVIPEEGNKEIIYGDFFLNVPRDIKAEFEMENWESCSSISISGVEVEWRVSSDDFDENETFNVFVRATTKENPEYDINSEYFNIYLLLCAEDDSIIEIKRIIAGPYVEEVRIATILEKKLEPGIYEVYLAFHIGADPPEEYEHFAGPKKIKVYTELE